MIEQRIEGVVKWFNRKKGFGFIAATGVEGEIFIHYSNIRKAADDGTPLKNLYERQRVNFVLSRTQRGLAAYDLFVVEPNGQQKE